MNMCSVMGYCGSSADIQTFKKGFEVLFPGDLMTAVSLSPKRSFGISQVIDPGADAIRHAAL